MAKTAGMGDRLYLSGYDLSGDVGSLSRIAGGPRPLSVTGINVEAQERLGGIRDGGLDFMAYFNAATDQAHPRLSTLPYTDVLGTYLRGTTLGNPAASCVAKQINYDPTRGIDGSLTIGVQLQSNGYGIEWGTQLTAGARTDTGATNGTAVDFVDVSTSFGWQAYLQVTGVTGTSVTVALEDSDDNVSFLALSGASFTAATGATSQRLVSASSTATVRQYVRAVTTGTFNPATFVVMFVRNLTATAF